MFSKPLFKQSCKANGTMWLIITVAVCFMLSCVMLIAGDENMSRTKDGIENTIIKGEITADVQKRALNYYDIAQGALEHFDGDFKHEFVFRAAGVELTGQVKTLAMNYYDIAVGALSYFDGAFKEEFAALSADDGAKAAYAEAYGAALVAGKSPEDAALAGQAALAGAVYPAAYRNALGKLRQYASSAASEAGFTEDSKEAKEIQGAIFVAFNPPTETGEAYKFDDFYEALGEQPPRYDVQSLMTATETERAAYRVKYAEENSAVFLAGNTVKEENIRAAAAELAKQGVTAEQLSELGFDKYGKVKEIASSAIAAYTDALAHASQGESAQDIKARLADGTADMTEAFTAAYKEAAEELQSYTLSLAHDRLAPKSFLFKALSRQLQKRSADIAAAASASKSACFRFAAEKFQKHLSAVARDEDYIRTAPETQEIQGVVFMVLNPPDENDKTGETYKFDDFYAKLGEQPPRYELQSLMTATETERAAYREKYAADYGSIFLAGNMTSEENVRKTLKALEEYRMTAEKYAEFGFTDYENVKEIAFSAISTYKSDYAYRLQHIGQDETPESIKKELTEKITKSLLNNLPAEVSDSIREIGQMDLYGTLIGSVFFKMAGLLLPIIYLIMTANALIAGQVDSGSMAYVLSSSIKRRSVTITQAIYLVGSLFAMFCLTLCTSMVCFSRVSIFTTLSYGKLAVINLGAFLVMFAMSGICFLTSCVFNRSKFSMSVGGGINMFFLVATMLGLFGSSVMPKVVRMSALNLFNYVSIISLFDVVSILDGGFGYIWKLCILFVIGVVCYAVGTEKFVSKDLPL